MNFDATDNGEVERRDPTSSAGYVALGTFGPGSSITLGFDPNGTVTLASGSVFVSQNVVSPSGLGSVSTTESFSFSGGIGTLSGDTILWSPGTGISHGGSFVCTGAPLCSFLGVPAGVSEPIAILDAFQSSTLGTTLLTTTDLGRWLLSGDHTRILGSTNAFVTNGFSSGVDTSEWLVFGSLHVPEPAEVALVAPLAIGLALRKRRQRRSRA